MSAKKALSLQVERLVVPWILRAPIVMRDLHTLEKDLEGLGDATFTEYAVRNVRNCRLRFELLKSALEELATIARHLEGGGGGMDKTDS